MSKSTISRIAVFGLFAAVSFSGGCASITRGTKDTLVVESEPAGADVKLSTGFFGKTPAAFKLPRKDSLVVYISKPGYKPISVNVVPQVVTAGRAGMAGNLIVGGLLGAAVDAGTGSMKDLKPNPVRVKLELISSTTTPSRDPPDETAGYGNIGQSPPRPSQSRQREGASGVMEAGSTALSSLGNAGSAIYKGVGAARRPPIILGNQAQRIDFGVLQRGAAARVINPRAFESQIDGVSKGWDGETIVKLTNGQIWEQTEYHYHYHYAFMPRVILSNSNGLWKMKVDDISKAVGVQRIK
jgi:hypothetical protein